MVRSTSTPSNAPSFKCKFSHHLIVIPHSLPSYPSLPIQLHSTRLNSTRFENATQKRFHNHNPIEFNSNRGGINLETEKTHDGTTSRLLLTRAQLRDGGNYTCMPHGAIPASGFVHVLNGENSLLYSQCCWKHSNLMTLNAISSPLFVLFKRRTSGSKIYEWSCTLVLLPKRRSLHYTLVVVPSLSSENRWQLFLLYSIELTTIRMCMSSCKMKLM